MTHVQLDGSGASHTAQQRSGRTGAYRPSAPALGRDRRRSGVLLAFAVNELTAASDRSTLLSRLIEHARGGGHVVVVEPLAGFVAPWWKDWQREFEGIGGRADEWRFRISLPRSSRSSIVPPVSTTVS